jgi:MFS family permease
VPLYPLYALLFADAGLSESRISALLAIWTAVAVVAEVPCGALADRFSRHLALVAGGVLQAAGYVLWTALPGFTGFAAGFVLWGLGGALVSGSLEALLYDGLAATGAEAHYARVLGRVEAAGLLAQIPAAVAATALFALGGYVLVGWASVGACLAAAALATRLPEPPRERATPDDEPGYLATLRAGILEVTGRPPVRAAVLAVAVLTGIDAVEEYFPLLARDWRVPTSLIPLAMLATTLAGAAGAALGGAGSRLRPPALAAVLVAAVVALGAAGLVRQPVSLAALALFYGLYRLVLVVADARLQERIDGPARATVTSVAGLGTELAALGLLTAWALGGLQAVAALTLLVAAALTRLGEAGSRREDLAPPAGGTR